MLGARTLNTETLDADQYPVINNGNGDIVDVEQVVAIFGDGSIITFEQSVELRIATTVPESIITIEQVVQSELSSFPILYIEQSVVNAALTTFYTRNGWYPTITVNGWQVPDNQLTGICEYQHDEDGSALFNFSIIPPLGVQSLYTYQGMTVTCDIKVAAGTYRIFTGKIDIPEIDIMNERITFRCSDNRDERIMLGQAGSSSLIGNYSETVFGIYTDLKTEVNNRLSTIPYSLDFDGYGNPYLTSWTPKASADFSLGDSTVYRRAPSVRIESRAKIVNNVNITFNYNYQRFHHRQISYTWIAPYSNSPSDFLTKGYSMASRSMIQSAVDAARWPVRGTISFTPILASGFYRFGSFTVAWTTSIQQGVATPVLDSAGNAVVDPAGQAVKKVVPTTVTDVAQIYCFGAAWNATTRWSQNITEQYTLSVVAPQSQSLYGTVSATDTMSFTDVNTSSAWDNYTTYQTPSDSSITDENYYINQDLTISEFNNATTVVINRARTKILAAHRDSRAIVQVAIWPQIDLRHTVGLTTGRLQCRGKVFSVKHSFDLSGGDAFTTVELALFRATGSQSDSSFVPPSRPSDIADPSLPGISLGSHYGEDPSQSAAASWTGHIGNKYITVASGAFIDTRKTTYQESFVVDTPPIEDSARLTKVLAASQTYNVSIPADNLVWTTVGH